jgi:ABC-type multidrug transport system ATPase subunit
MVPGLNASLVCNSNPIVYSASHMTCDVVQVLLQSLFPGTTKLSISRFLNGSLTPGGINGLASAGIANGEGEIWAQLWYNGVEQFYCHASECTQEVVSETSSSDWNCPQLSCTCRPGTSFCGGGTTATQNLTSAIDGLGGPLEVSCTPDGTCSFKQQFLTIFGNSGLPLSGCRFGECVNQYVIDQALGISEAKTGDNGLSGGVIAGLAVVGAIVLLIILAIVWGLIARAKARKAAPDASLFKKSGAGMAWHDIGYEVKGHGRGMYQATMAWLRGTGAPARAGTPQSENGTMVTSTGGRVVLHDVGGELPPGAFACILGPSGAGKSTLVDILAGRRKAGKVVGKVSYTTETPGRPVKIGYCDQSDVLNPTSTVIETLRFAAFLRLPENIPADVKEARAQTVLTQLGLAGIANTRVGSGETRGISGGEMRRVSIGIELVANPDILILDEPTSGLDSVSAARVINLLKSLTTDPENRTTIVASVHQPSSALYHAFSQVILLSAGRQLYFGPGGSAPADYFTAQGRPCPVGYNIADHLLELASEPDGLHSGSTASPTRSPRSGTPSKSTSDEKNPEVDLAELYEQEQTAHWWPKSHCATTFLTQFEVLAGREWRNLCRDKFLFPTHFLLAVIIGLFGGGCFFQT